MIKARKRVLAAAAAAVAVGVSASVVYAATRGANGIAVRHGAASGDLVSGHCKVSKMAFVSHGAGNSTTSTSFVDLPGAVVTFSVGGTTPTCLMVSFTSVCFAGQSGQQLKVRALLDNSVVSEPPEVEFVGPGIAAGAESNAMNFLWTNVAPGNHTVKIQFVVGGTVFLHEGTTVVFYR